MHDLRGSEGLAVVLERRVPWPQAEGGRYHIALELDRRDHQPSQGEYPDEEDEDFKGA